MSTIRTMARIDAQAPAPWRLLFAQANRSVSRNSTTGLTAPGRTQMLTYITNLISWLSLWIPLLTAIWLCRGWIGLFCSGQVLSAGACLFQILAKRTCYAFSASKKPAHGFKSE
jgi:hypothetical protein